MNCLAISFVIAATQSPTSGQEPWIFNPKGYEVPLVYRQELEKNLLWMIDRRQRRAERDSTIEPTVGVYVDAGAWHLGA